MGTAEAENDAVFQHESRYSIHTITADKLLERRLSFGSRALDAFTNGGIPLFPITEIAGEAGVGKTQLLMTLALSALIPPDLGGLGSGCLYISTEGRVPLARMKTFSQENDCFKDHLGEAALEHIFVEDGISDANALWILIRERVPQFLASGLVKLVVIDSIASLFRGEFTGGPGAMQDRNDWFFGLASMMKRLSCEYDAYFVVANQVSFDPHLGKVKPALGLAWSSCVNQRLLLEFADPPCEMGAFLAPSHSNIENMTTKRRGRRRKLSVVFSPSLPCGVIYDSCFVESGGLTAQGYFEDAEPSQSPLIASVLTCSHESSETEAPSEPESM